MQDHCEYFGLHWASNKTSFSLFTHTGKYKVDTYCKGDKDKKNHLVAKSVAFHKLFVQYCHVHFCLEKNVYIVHNAQRCSYHEITECCGKDWKNAMEQLADSKCFVLEAKLKVKIYKKPNWKLKYMGEKLNACKELLSQKRTIKKLEV